MTVELVATLDGRTIVKAHYRPESSERNPELSECAELWLYLDDGRVIACAGRPTEYGEEATVIIEEIRIVDVTACLKCGQAHGDRRTYISEGRYSFEREIPVGKAYAFCTDGIGRAWVEP